MSLDLTTVTEKVNTEFGSGVRSLRQDLAHTLVGNVVFAGAQAGILITLARLGSPEIVGEYSLALALVSPVFMFTNMRLNSLYASDASRQYTFVDYSSTRAICSVMAVAACVVLAATARYNAHVVLCVLLLSIAKFGDSQGDLAQGYLNLRRRFDRVARSLQIRGALSLTVVACAIAISHDVACASAALAVVSLAVSWLVDARYVALTARDDAIERGHIQSNLAFLISWLRPTRAAGPLIHLALPLGFVALATSLNASIPRLFIERHEGARDLGYFAAIAYVTVVGRMLASSLGLIAIPRFGDHLVRQNRRGFVTLLLKLIVAGAALGLVGLLLSWLVGRRLLAVLYGPDYGMHVDVLLWLMAATGLGYISTFLQDSLTSMRALIPKALLLVGTAAALAGLCQLLVPTDGIHGAAMAVFYGSIVELLGSVVLVFRAVSAQLTHAAAH